LHNTPGDVPNKSRATQILGIRSRSATFYEAIRQATKHVLEESRTRLVVLSLVLKWAGLALLVVACVVAVYLGAALLGELVVWAAYP
jgi:hypothetical protein